MSNVIHLSGNSLTKRRKLSRRVNRQKIITAQVVPFPSRGHNYVSPVLLGDAAALLPLTDGPMTLPNVSSHFRERGPEPEHFTEGLHRADNAGDDLSRQVAPIIPVTKDGRSRTMHPMGRGVTPVNFKTQLAERLRAARVVAGYETQQDFAKALGIAWETYKKYESGRTPLPHHLIPLVCELTNQDANYFFGVGSKVVRRTA